MNSLFTIFFHFFVYLTIFQIQSWLMIKKYLLHYFQLSSFFFITLLPFTFIKFQSLLSLLFFKYLLFLSHIFPKSFFSI
jgi:hypothetical protein